MTTLHTTIAPAGSDAARSGTSDPAVPARSRRKARLAAVGLAVLAAVVLWAIAEIVFGIDLQSPASPGQPGFDIGPAIVAATAAVASLAGWGLLAVLERVTARARTVWTVAAVVVLLASFGGPLSGTGITAANRAVLALLHLAVGAVLISGLSRTAAASRTANGPA